MNPLSLAAPLRDARLNVLRDAIDGGIAAGSLTIYDGPRPSMGGIANAPLAKLKFAYPCAPDALAGALNFSPIAPTAADATGTAAWARATDSAGNIIFDCDVGVAGAPIVLDNINLAVGGKVAIESAAITEGNA
jgi:hypothetical protein